MRALCGNHLNNALVEPCRNLNRLAELVFKVVADCGIQQ